MNNRPPSLYACCVAEITGTFILIFLGCGAVHAAVTTGAISGAGQVAMVWGLAVALAVFATGNISGAHINPAITLAMMCFGGFPRKFVLPYCLSQLVGAALAALCLFLIFGATIEAYELENGITRGAPGSEITASMYGEYFPNPGVDLHGSGPQARPENLSTPAAMVAEGLGTALLAFMVFALTDRKNRGAPGSGLAPLFVGATVLALVVVLGPMTQACLNPARDFGPRIVAYFCGWGEVAFPGPRGAGPTLLVYLVAPLAGGVLGAFTYSTCLGRHQPESPESIRPEDSSKHA